MSVAFTKEESAETASETLLPDRPISPHANLVTQAGLDDLQSRLEKARADYKAAQKIEDVNEQRRQSAIPIRDIRYLTERVRSAQLMPQPESTGAVSFGSKVRFERADGRVQEFRIVGEDEANPTEGTMSYVAPVARMVMGKSVGDVVGVGDQEIEVIAIS